MNILDVNNYSGRDLASICKCDYAYIFHFDFQQIDKLLCAVMHLLGLQWAAIYSTEALSAWCFITGSDRIVVYG